MENNRGSRVTAVPALMYCTVLQDKEILEAVASQTCNWNGKRMRCI